MTETLTGGSHDRGQLRARGLSPEMQKRIRDLWDEGKFLKEISVIVGKPIAAIADYLSGVTSPDGDAKRSLARKRRAAVGYATSAARQAGVARPQGVVSPHFSDEWYEENHASFVAGMRAAYPGAREHAGSNRFDVGGF